MKLNFLLVSPRSLLGLVAASASTLAVSPVAFASDGNAVVAIASRVSGDYVRPRLPNGTFVAETYAFGKGGLAGGNESDHTIDELGFEPIARTIAGPLASQNFVSSADPKGTKLLIMVYWGTTGAPENANTSIAMQNMSNASAAMSSAKGGASSVRFDNTTAGCTPPKNYNDSPFTTNLRTKAEMRADNAMTGALAMVSAEDKTRDQIDALNAAMLGYDSWWNETAGFKSTPFEYRRQDMIMELEERRYFVVLMAYDFQMMWKQKKAKLLWETRYSIRERGNEFDKQLAAMTSNASRYFGKNSAGLIHNVLPEGHVDLGPLKEIPMVQPN
jgi:hypothetical protein